MVARARSTTRRRPPRPEERTPPHGRLARRAGPAGEAVVVKRSRCARLVHARGAASRPPGERAARLRRAPARRGVDAAPARHRGGRAHQHAGLGGDRRRAGLLATYSERRLRAPPLRALSAARSSRGCTRRASGPGPEESNVSCSATAHRCASCWSTRPRLRRPRRRCRAASGSANLVPARPLARRLRRPSRAARLPGRVTGAACRRAGATRSACAHDRARGRSKDVSVARRRRRARINAWRTHLPISALVICGNEAHPHPRLPREPRWCEEIVVVDSYFDRRPGTSCRSTRPTSWRRPWNGHVEQKQYALDHSAPSVGAFNVDADECAVAGLREEIEEIRARRPRLRRLPRAARRLLPRAVVVARRLVSGPPPAPVPQGARAVWGRGPAREGVAAGCVKRGASRCCTAPTTTSAITCARSTASRPRRQRTADAREAGDVAEVPLRPLGRFVRFYLWSFRLPARQTGTVRSPCRRRSTHPSTRKQDERFRRERTVGRVPVSLKPPRWSFRPRRSESAGSAAARRRCSLHCDPPARRRTRILVARIRRSARARLGERGPATTPLECRFATTTRRAGASVPRRALPRRRRVPHHVRAAARPAVARRRAAGHAAHGLRAARRGHRTRAGSTGRMDAVIAISRAARARAPRARIDAASV